MPIMHIRPPGRMGYLHLGQDDGTTGPPAAPPPANVTPGAGADQQPSWMSQQFIQGIPNWVLLGGFVLWTIVRRPSRGGK